MKTLGLDSLPTLNIWRREILWSVLPEKYQCNSSISPSGGSPEKLFAHTDQQYCQWTPTHVNSYVTVYTSLLETFRIHSWYFYQGVRFEPSKWVRLHQNEQICDFSTIRSTIGSVCIEIWSKKVPDLSYLVPICPTFGPNLTSLTFTSWENESGNIYL